MNIIETLEKEQLRNDIPEFRPGDTVRVHVKVVEGKNERIQMYEGVVIARKNAGLRETFTVRRISYGVGVQSMISVVEKYHGVYGFFADHGEFRFQASM